MALIPFDDLIEPVTEEEATDSLLNVAQALSLPATSWQSGGVARTLLAVNARTLYTSGEVLSVAARGPYLTLAKGDWLTSLAERNYNTPRNPPTKAEGYVNVVNSTPNNVDKEPGEITVSNVVTGKTYTSITAYHSVGNDTIPVLFAADDYGSAWTAQTGQITQLVTSIIGVTVSNAAALIGTDEETDDLLEVRAQSCFAPLSPLGPYDVYRAILTDRLKTQTIDAINRVITYPDFATGIITVVVAGSAGELSPSDVAIAQAAVDKWCTPQCIRVTVVSATAVVINVDYTLYTKDNSATQAQVENALRSVLGSAINGLPIGGLITPPSLTGRVDIDMLRAQPFVYNSKVVKDVDLTAPMSNVVLSAYEVAQLGTLNVTVVPL